MDPLSSPVTLLILTSREDEAERIVTSLRNGGLAVRAIFSPEPERMEELAAAHRFELILCCDYDPGIDLQLCLARYRALGLDVPLVVIADQETDPSVLIGALRAGARDLTEQGDTEHLQLVVARELADLRHRRAETQLRQRLAECEERARGLIEATGDAVAYIQEGMHVQVNPAYQGLFRFAALEDFEGLPLLDLVADALRVELRQALRRLERAGDGESAELRLQCLRADGSQFEAAARLSRSNLDGEPCLRVMLQEQAGTAGIPVPGLLDADTGLPNRPALLAELAARLDRRGGAPDPFGVIYVGIRVFPRILQSEGLTTALEAAAAFGASLREAAPDGAFLARVCDDGFVLLVEESRQADLVELGARISSRTRLPLGPAAAGEEAKAWAIGLMLAHPGSDSAADVLNTVFRDFLFSALDVDHTQSQGTATVSGRSESPQPSAFGDQDRRFIADIDRALEGDGFELFYQPIVSLKGDSQENYNVLLRLRDDQHTLHEAKEFLTAAVSAGRMVAVDRWVIRRSIAEIAAKRAQNQKINFFINLGEDTLQEDKLLILICDCLRDSQARGNWLTFQVLEDHARRHAAAFMRLSEGLRKVKCRVALNRFGLGPNPETILKTLRMDFVKFAPELGHNLAEDEAKQRRLLELTHLARDAGVRSVVTGVEDARTLTVLWTAGIDYVQGNFLQRPAATIEAHA
jgi:EAL domain-containing protein (putative c-di-GMP-specific phosphodiesterase class I)/GGDEF domain-containing protein/PAS domain-containing protein